MSVLRIERRDRVAILTFDDPDRRNVVSDEMNEENPAMPTHAAEPVIRYTMK